MNQLLMHLELTKTIVDIADVESLMLTTMNPKLKKLHEGFIEIDMIKRRFVKGKHVRRGMRPPKLYFNA